MCPHHPHVGSNVPCFWGWLAVLRWLGDRVESSISQTTFQSQGHPGRDLFLGYLIEWFFSALWSFLQPALSWKDRKLWGQDAMLVSPCCNKKKIPYKGDFGKKGLFWLQFQGTQSIMEGKAELQGALHWQAVLQQQRKAAGFLHLIS